MILAEWAPLLAVLSQGYFGIRSPQTLAQGAEAICNDPVGSGPFIVQKWTHGQNITFVRNPNYNSAPANALHQGPAYVDKIIWSLVADPTTRYGSLTTGQSDVIYDVLYEHEPDHVLIQATRRDAARGLLDIERLGVLLRRIRHHIVHKPLDRISPLAVPILLDIGKTPIFGEARESVMADAADELMREAMGQAPQVPKRTAPPPSPARSGRKSDEPGQRGARRVGK